MVGYEIGAQQCSRFLESYQVSINPSSQKLPSFDVFSYSGASYWHLEPPGSGSARVVVCEVFKAVSRLGPFFDRPTAVRSYPDVSILY